jgi:nicotinamidase-related amidase
MQPVQLSDPRQVALNLMSGTALVRVVLPVGNSETTMAARTPSGGRARSGRARTVVIPARGTALLLIDVINDLAFEGSQPLVEQAEEMAARLAALKRRTAKAGIPSIYVNDNFGQWRSDFRKTVEHCTSARSPGREVSRRLRPRASDYFVLKPKHSGFYDTTLETLLESLKIRRVLVTGIAGNICVLFTANDAYMRGFGVIAPGDCIVSNDVGDNAHALRQIQRVLKGRVTHSTALMFRGRSQPAPQSDARLGTR